MTSGIVGFLPDVVSDVCAQPWNPDVVIVESLQALPHVRAVACLLDAEMPRIQYLGHAPAPSLTGGGRMATCRPDDALRLGDSAASNRRKLRYLRGPVLRHWERLWRLHRAAAYPNAKPDLAAIADTYHALSSP